jgi:CrcB protein
MSHPATPPAITPRVPSNWSAGLVVALIYAGGCIGALARAALVQALPPGDGWPWAIFIVNIVGVALLAYFATKLRERQRPSTYRRRFIETGVCGSLTTFSALPVEVIGLSRHGHAALAASYLVVTIVAGLIVMHTVTRLARRRLDPPAGPE